MNQDEGWLIDKESGIRYKEPEDREKCIWYVNYVKDSRTQNGVYTVRHASIGPMIYVEASRLFDKMDEGRTTMVSISKIPMSGTDRERIQ